MSGISFTLRLASLLEGDLVDAKNNNGYGFQFGLDGHGHLCLTISDPWTSQSLHSSRLPADAKAVSVVVNSLACIVSFYADGRFLDGGEERQFGFQRLNPYLRHFNWAREWRLERGLRSISVFNRALTGVEAIASLHDDA